MFVHVYVCVCRVSTIYSAGIRVWAWKNKTLTSKQHWADVVRPEAAAAACYYSVCVCLCERASVCVFGWRVHLCRQVGNEHAESLRWDVKFEACVYMSVHACLRFCTHTNTLSELRKCYACVCVCVCVCSQWITWAWLWAGSLEKSGLLSVTTAVWVRLKRQEKSGPTLRYLVYLAEWPWYSPL